MLRWFRDNYVSKEDIDHYYKMAPIIVDAINKSDECKKIYEDIYNNVIQMCLHAIEIGNYPSAYKVYKNSILNLEEEFARPLLEQRMVRALKSRLIY